MNNTHLINNVSAAIAQGRSLLIAAAWLVGVKFTIKWVLLKERTWFYEHKIYKIIKVNQLKALLQFFKLHNFWTEPRLGYSPKVTTDYEMLLYIAQKKTPRDFTDKRRHK